MDMKRLRDLLITVLGLWLMVSPRVLHFAAAQVDATWNTWMVGAAIILLTAVSRYLVDTRTPWEDLCGTALGFWLMISPWALGFSAHVAERSNSVVVGLAIAVSALWALIADTDLRHTMSHWVHQRRALR